MHILIPSACRAVTQANSFCYNNKVYFIAVWRLFGRRDHSLAPIASTSAELSPTFSLTLLYRYYPQETTKQKFVGGRRDVTFVSLFSTFWQFIIWEFIPPQPPRNLIWNNISTLSIKCEPAFINRVLRFSENCGPTVLPWWDQAWKVVVWLIVWRRSRGEWSLKDA